MIKVRALAHGVANAKKSDGTNHAEILIYEQIGKSWWDDSGVGAKQMVEELKALGDVDTITVRINSPGGSVSEGVAIYNALKNHGATIKVQVDASAYSIASIIAMAASPGELRMAENSLMMIHDPWMYAVGNADELRKAAALLDTLGDVLAETYSKRTGKGVDDVRELMLAETWMTASDAVEMGFADATIEDLKVAASADVSRFRNGAAALAKLAGSKTGLNQQEIEMRNFKKTPALREPAGGDGGGSGSGAAPAPGPAAATVVDTQAAIAAALRADDERRAAISALFKNYPAHVSLRDEILADRTVDAQAAATRLLASLGSQASPTVLPGADARDKFREASTQAILARAGERGADGKPIAVDRQNPMRGLSLLDMLRASAENSGINVRGLRGTELFDAVITHGTTDFPIVLENVMHKVLLSAYGIAADTWRRFCSVGTLNDFRPHYRYRMGSIADLEEVNEHGEFKYGKIGDAEKESITGKTKGKIISVTRQLVINDDLGAITGIARQLGRASARSIENDVYALLALNSNLGPTMNDGKSLFHADHANIAGSGAAPSVASFDAIRQLMAVQKEPGGNDFIGLTPAVFLGPTALGGAARVVNEAQFDVDVSNKFQVPNKSRGLFREIVDTPRLSGTRWFSFADPNVEAVLEVAFLDGVQEPYLATEEGFAVDGWAWKARLDWAAGAVGWRGAATNAGA